MLKFDKRITWNETQSIYITTEITYTLTKIDKRNKILQKDANRKT